MRRKRKRERGSGAWVGGIISSSRVVKKLQGGVCEGDHKEGGKTKKTISKRLVLLVRGENMFRRKINHYSKKLNTKPINKRKHS